jgi:DnaJ-domain-containing protein 1
LSAKKLGGANLLFKRVYSIISAEISSLLESFSVLEENLNEDKFDSFENSKENRSRKDFTLEEKYLAMLECKKEVSFETIKKQYRILMKRYHPDRFIKDPERYIWAEELCRELNKAYSYFENKNKKDPF